MPTYPETLLYIALGYFVGLFVSIQIVLYATGLRRGRFFNHKKFLEHCEKGLRKFYHRHYEEVGDENNRNHTS